MSTAPPQVTQTSYLKAWKAANREKVAAHNKTYRSRHKDEITASQKAARKRTVRWKAAHPRLALRSDAYHKLRQSYRDAIAPGYIATLLKMPVAALTPELIAIKTEQLATFRLSRSIKADLKTHSKQETANHETV